MWRQQVRLVLGRATGRQWSEADFDFEKAFVNVSRRKLAEIAKRHDYPFRHLAMSLASYLWQRRLLMNRRIVSEPIWASRFIGAGSALATFLLALFLLEAALNIRDLPQRDSDRSCG